MDELFLRFIGAVCDGNRNSAYALAEEMDNRVQQGGESPPKFPRQDDGSKTPVPAKFIGNLRKMLR